MSHLQTNLNFLNSAINILLNRAAGINQARSALQRLSYRTKLCVARPGLIFISICACICMEVPLLWLSVCGHYYYYCWTSFMYGYQKQKQQQNKIPPIWKRRFIYRRGDFPEYLFIYKKTSSSTLTHNSETSLVRYRRRFFTYC